MEEILLTAAALFFGWVIYNGGRVLWQDQPRKYANREQDAPNNPPITGE